MCQKVSLRYFLMIRYLPHEIHIVQYECSPFGERHVSRNNIKVRTLKYTVKLFYSSPVLSVSLCYLNIDFNALLTVFRCALHGVIRHSVYSTQRFSPSAFGLDWFHCINIFEVKCCR